MKYLKQINLYLLMIMFLSVFGQSNPKNILFIAVDDLRPLINSYGNSQMITPHLDQLSKSGIQFNNAYCNIAVCGGSRASIMTGIRPSYTRFAKYYSKASEDTPEAKSLHGLFKQNGYETYSYGKIFHFAEDFESDWTFIDDSHEQFDYQTQDSKAIVKTLDPKGRRKGPAFEFADVKDDKYSDGKITEMAIKRLKKLKNKTTPFFLAVGYVSPHLPFIQPTKYGNLYKDGDLQLASNPYKIKDAPKNAVHNSPELRGMYTGIPEKGLLSEELSKQLIHGYYASVSYTDALVGKLIKTLDDLNLREDTIIILWGDHGFFLGEHGMWTKHSTLREAIHVPLIIDVPGMKSGVESDTFIEYIDIYPTLCDLTGITTPAYLHGKSFKSVLVNPENKHKTEIYTRYANGEAVVDSDFAYTEFVNNEGFVWANMLFDLNNDTKQNQDLSNNQNFKDVVKLYKLKLLEMRNFVNQPPIK